MFRYQRVIDSLVPVLMKFGKVFLANVNHLEVCNSIVDSLQLAAGFGREV
jgi:hypothetical protein